MAKKALIVSISSDIGSALAIKLKKEGYEVYGTSRQISQIDHDNLISCDLSSAESVDKAAARLMHVMGGWDILVFAAGAMEPVGCFADVDFQEWQNCLTINLINPLRLLHKLLPFRQEKASVLFFAGGGTNNTPTHYSGYILSKIASIKMCELLDAEIPDTRFVIIGPGWVKTKIHETTFAAGNQNAGPNYTRALEIFKNNSFVPMDDVVDCCYYLLTTASPAVNGRNFSVQYDKWRESSFEEQLAQDPHKYKLRRAGN